MTTQLALPQATIEYQEFGPQDSAHPPVFFVHGAVVDGELWREVAEKLGRLGYRCIVPTLPLGSHTIPVTDARALSLQGVAGIVNDTIEALDLSEVTLVGSDTGGGICQLAVDARPDRIGRLVLTNCDAFDQCPPFPFDRVFGLLRGPISIKALMEPMRLAALRNSALGFGLLISRPDRRVTARWINPCLNDSRIRRDLAALLRQIAVTDLTDVANRLHTFDKPVTLVWGQSDVVFKPSLGRRLAAAFSNAKLIEVPGSRTFVSLDEPDAVIDAIAA
jgi:pimeloyl-ACP methyl ester carboxylesterase